jgi:DmsE family decaheme c-type cytochrome
MRFKRLVAIAGLSLFGVFGSVYAATGSPARDASAECVSCHDEEDLPDMSLSPHALPVKKKAPMSAAAEQLQGRPMGDPDSERAPTCITCHGPSPTHIKKPEGVKDRPAPDRVFGKKTRLTPEQRSDVCQTCHQKDPKQMLWDGSRHQNADLACNSCHKVHTNKDKLLTKTGQTEVCFTCHKAQRAQINLISRHPIPEGKMGCSDCHNVHGSVGPMLAKRDSTNVTCYTCHAEKRGPFVHEHQPVTEDCMSCHSPHGSVVAGMLKARPPMLCQQCHTPHVAGGVGALGGQPGVYTQAPGQTQPLITSTTSGKNVIQLWQGRSCMNCHTKVHGSNNPSATHPTPQLMLR